MALKLSHMIADILIISVQVVLCRFANFITWYSANTESNALILIMMCNSHLLSITTNWQMHLRLQGIVLSAHQTVA